MNRNRMIFLIACVVCVSTQYGCSLFSPQEATFPVAVHNRVADTLQIYFNGDKALPLLLPNDAHRYNPKVRVKSLSYSQSVERADLSVAAKNLRTKKLSRVKKKIVHTDEIEHITFDEYDW